NSLEVVGRVLQNRQQRFRFACNLQFPNDLACVIHNADARLLDRNVQSRKMVHAALLLLMLEAVTTDLVFTISLKRSTQNSSAIHRLAGRLPHPPRRTPTLSPHCRMTESDPKADPPPFLPISHLIRFKKLLGWPEGSG